MGWREVFKSTQDRKYRKYGKYDNSGQENISDISDFSGESGDEDPGVGSADQGSKLAPELVQLIELVAAHYHCPPDEIVLMKSEAGREPDEAMRCFRNIAEREGLTDCSSTNASPAPGGDDADGQLTPSNEMG